jgi:hypothetical protein
VKEKSNENEFVGKNVESEDEIPGGDDILNLENVSKKKRKRNEPIVTPTNPSSSSYDPLVFSSSSPCFVLGSLSPLLLSISNESINNVISYSSRGTEFSSSSASTLSTLVRSCENAYKLYKKKVIMTYFSFMFLIRDPFHLQHPFLE